MTYDFTTIMDRSGKDALAVDSIGADVSWAQAPTAPRLRSFRPDPPCGHPPPGWSCKPEKVSGQ